MKINNLYIDTGVVSLNKHGETLCGDNVEIIKKDDLSVIVLSDGLGSGVKANILSILTSKMLATMLANDVDVDKCIKTLASILPICKERNIAYSTFTAIKVTDNNYAQIVEYDNPKLIILRNGKVLELSRTSTKIDDKIIYLSSLNLELNDCLIALSDGTIHAGIGQNLNFGWERPNIVSYIEEKYSNSFSAKTIASIIIDKCDDLYANSPGDDTTACAVKVLERKSVNIVIGPPSDKDDDKIMMNFFFAKKGKHIVCGGTTATIVSKFLNKPIDNSIDLAALNSEIPPISHIDGVDLVTEGVVTINKVLFYLKDYLEKNEYYYYWIGADDGASLITKLLIEESTDINFFVGKAVNPAHQNPDLKIGFNIKMKLIEEVTKYLELIGKKVNISYF